MKLKYLLKKIFTVLFFALLMGCVKKQEIEKKISGHLEINDVQHYYEICGTGDTLIILHGGPGLSHQYLKPQLDSLLSSHFTLLFYDQRGSGWSEGISDTTKLNIETFVDDLEQIRKYFKINRVNLLGHSFGGLLAMHYAVEFPDKTNSLILVDTDAASYELRTPYQMKMINERLTEDQLKYLDGIEKTPAFGNFDPGTYEKYYKIFLTTYFANPRDTAKLHLGFDSISIPKIELTNRVVRNNLGNYDIHNKLSNITSKTLIMHGRESVFSVEGAMAIKEGIPASEIYLFENTGHFEYIESPEKFKNLILDFFMIK